VKNVTTTVATLWICRQIEFSYSNHICSLCL